MATTLLDDPVAPDEPAVIHDPEQSGIKAMAAKFRENWPDTSKPTPTPSAAPQSTAPTAPVAAPEPKPAPVTSPAAETEIEDVKVDHTTPLSREHYKKLEQAKESYKSRAEKLRLDHEAAVARAKQLEEELTKTKAALPPNLEEVQKALADSKRIADEHKALTEQLETINLERSPRFQNWWNTETQKHIKVAAAQIPPDKRAEFTKLVMENPSEERNAAIDAILEPLSNTGKRLANGALEQLESLKIQRDEALTQGSERYKQLQAHEKEEADKAAKAYQAKISHLSDEAIRRAKQRFSAFQPTGDAARDAAIAEREAFVRAVVTGKVDEDTLLSLPAAAVEYLHMKDTVVPALKAELAKQAELLKQLQGANPRASEGKGPAASKKQEADDGTSFAARVRQLMQK